MYKNSGKYIEVPQWAEDDKLYSAYGSVKGEYEEMGKLNTYINYNVFKEKKNKPFYLILQLFNLDLYRYLEQHFLWLPFSRG